MCCFDVVWDCECVCVEMYCGQWFWGQLIDYCFYVDDVFEVEVCWVVEIDV